MAEYLSEEDMNTGEYISRDLALKQLNATCLATDCDNYNGVRCRACAYADAMDFIEAIPAADVHPVKRGQWLKVQGKQGDYFLCSNCGTVEKTESEQDGAVWWHDEYCPKCGARMDGDVE